MLVELKVENFAIIDSLLISFRGGLNILSGETGAGKSILLKSLSLLMGEKADADVVRSGVEFATIEGFFDLSKRSDVVEHLANMGIEASDDELVVKRIVAANGKNKVYLNGSLSPLASLKNVVAPLIGLTGAASALIEMTGQHDNRHLQSKAYHLELLDQYTGSWNLRIEFEKEFQRLADLREELASLETAARSREQRLDFLKYQRDEIEAMNLRAGEEDELENKVQRIRNSARLVEYVSSSLGALYSDDDAVMVRLHQVLQRGQELAQIDSEINKRLGSLQQAKALIEDAVYEMREYGKNLDSGAEDLNAFEERLSQLRRLQKKFGQSVEEILKAHEEIVAEIETLEGSDERLKELAQEILKLEKKLGLLGKDLHQKRGAGARKLEQAVNDELAELNMKGVLFSIQVRELEEMNSVGLSDVEFMIQPSKKDEPKPLAKIASGGELSRILLSLKRVVGGSDRPRTYLFDEVDTGVSGQTAEKVGKKLHTIAKGQQVICVTHLPQVARFADGHFLIEKSSASKSGVKMKVIELAKEERVREIARLISGEKITASSLEHARELLR